MDPLPNWLALAAVVLAFASLVATVVIGVVAWFFARQTFLKVGGHELARLRDSWKERLRSNIARLLEAVDRYKSSDPDEQAEMRPELIRLAARTKLMLTPGKHEEINRHIDRLIHSVNISVDESLIEVSRPVLKGTWEQIEDHMVGRQRRGE